MTKRAYSVDGLKKEHSWLLDHVQNFQRQTKRAEGNNDNNSRMYFENRADELVETAKKVMKEIKRKPRDMKRLGEEAGQGY